VRRSILLLLILALACKNEMRRAALTRSEPVARVAASEAAAPQLPAGVPVRMIVRTANVTLIVKDAEQALRNITTAVESRGGYVGETKQWRENEQARATVVVRVPSSGLSAALNDIRKQAIRVESESVSAQDISEEFTDLSAQLVNAQATEKELRELLTTVRQRSQKAADILEVYNELTKVRGEIERLRGRINYLSQTVALSTITIELVPDVLAKPVVEPGWRPLAIFRDAARALVDTMKVLAAAIIWTIVYLLPIGLVFVVAALIVRQIWRAARRRRSS
jgi:hypothetical protein